MSKSQPTKRKKTSRTEQSEETRQLLLDVSLGLFVHQGYAGTTVRDLAKAAGVSPGLMFHYFPSKQALLEEHVKTVVYGIASVADMLGSSTRPIETFHLIAKTILQSFEQKNSRYLFLLAGQVVSIDSIPLAIKKKVSVTKSIEASIPVIVAGQRKREIKKGDPLQLAITFWGALQGIAEILVWNDRAVAPEVECVMSILEI